MLQVVLSQVEVAMEKVNLFDISFDFFHLIMIHLVWSGKLDL